jgi:hypothetical protein
MMPGSNRKGIRKLNVELSVGDVLTVRNGSGSVVYVLRKS